jgi:hypothetical protein
MNILCASLSAFTTLAGNIKRRALLMEKTTVFKSKK